MKKLYALVLFFPYSLFFFLLIPSRTIAIISDKPLLALAAEKPPQVNILPVVMPPTPLEVRSFVKNEAIRLGVNSSDALWIVDHESQDGVNMSGDDGISIGYWMFNLKANPQVARSCAMDLRCSTDLALNWILAGKIEKWSTWRLRCSWYKDAPDCE